jgi:hypothetical protein
MIRFIFYRTLTVTVDSSFGVSKVARRFKYFSSGTLFAFQAIQFDASGGRLKLPLPFDGASSQFENQELPKGEAVRSPPTFALHLPGCSLLHKRLANI